MRWHPFPAQLYAAVEQTPGTVLLESAAPIDAATSSASSPVSRLFTAPLRILTAHTVAELAAFFAEIDRAVAAGLYAAGYFAYECAAFFEPKLIASLPTSSTAEPLAWIGIYQPPQVFNHLTGQLHKTGKQVPCPVHSASSSGMGGIAHPPEATLALTQPEYTQRIHAIHQLIRSGDVYQLNFTVPLSVRAPGSPAALYQSLRSRQPAPYGAFLHTQPGRHILSFSPELFFRIHTDADTRRITTRPMKGTASRGRTTQEDDSQSAWLAHDPKNRAENVMIVDLLRNDLGRLCQFGSVHVHDLFAVERYPTLWQMTSTVTGQLRPDANFEQIFRALFPCGSVTGAPKIRAIQLLAQLEQRPRGVYTGAIGFFSPEETVFNVAIRTLTLRDGHGVLGVGSGIVIDSDPAAEFEECLLKARFLSSSAPAAFSLIETMLWNGRYPLLDLHLDRLQDSARYFAYPFNRAQIQSALNSHANSLCAPSIPRSSAEWVGEHEPAFAHANPPSPHSRAAGANPPHPAPPRKIRLLLHADGSLDITSEPIPEPNLQPLRIRIAAERTDPADPMYFHKTTHRPLYAQALQAARAAGYDDVLFLNHRGEVTEAAIHNVFIEKDGRLLTPPAACGLLPGVHRRHVLATNPNAEECVLRLDDLRHADRVYLSNAVRGLRPTIIDWEAP